MRNIKRFQRNQRTPLDCGSVTLHSLAFVLSAISVAPVYADIGSDLEGFFKQMGSSANITTPGAHQDQSAGYYSGGGISLRNRSKRAQLATLQLPRFESGCGGIDIFLGGFSHIKAAELINVLKSIGTSAASYAFKLAIKTISPMIDGLITELNDLATKINQSNINSCEMASTLLGGAWPKDDRTSHHLCTSMGSNLGMLSDWAAARQGCGAGGQKREILARRNNSKEYQNILVDEFNIAWEVIKKNHMLYSDHNLAELCMSISGSILSKNQNGNRTTRFLPSKANDDLIKALLVGGEAQVYSCTNKDKCLDVTEKKIHIASSKAFLNKVREMLKTITTKTVVDDPLTADEINFINNTKLPIYKMINVLSAYKQRVISAQDFTEVVSIDFLYKYMTDILDVMLEEASNLKTAQISDKEINRFIKGLYRVKERINKKRTNIYQQMNYILMMIESSQIYEKRIENTFDSMQHE